jgi:hypothetical protein
MNWRIAKASIIGTGHDKTGMPCQDSHYVMQLRDTLIIAVSDGLGSAKLSHEGSRIACASAVEAYANTVEAALNATALTQPSDEHTSAPFNYESALQTAFFSARNALERESSRTQLPLRDYACTLLIAVVEPESWYSMHIGDGTIVGLYTQHSAKTLSIAENGEFINSTTPITSDDYQSHMRYAHGHELLAGVALLSDGVTPMCINYKTGNAYDGFFRPLQTWLADAPQLSGIDESLKQFLDTPKMRQKSDDDMTLVLALREQNSDTLHSL